MRQSPVQSTSPSYILTKVIMSDLAILNQILTAIENNLLENAVEQSAVILRIQTLDSAAEGDISNISQSGVAGGESYALVPLKEKLQALVMEASLLTAQVKEMKELCAASGPGIIRLVRC